MIKHMKNKFGALFFVAIAAQTLPLNAQGVSPAEQDRNAQNQVVATQAATIDASDVTGSIDKGAKVKVTVTPVDSTSNAQGKPATSYEEAFRNWRSCAIAHQGVGNPAPQCETLRVALRQAIGLRPRGYQTVDAGPRN
jgi:hypothetical protein